MLHDDVAEFAALARPLLDADPLRHTVTLTVLGGLLGAGDRAAALLTVRDGATVVGAALRTPRRLVLVSAVQARHSAAVEAALADVDPELPGAAGPVPEAEAFAAARAARTGEVVHVALRMRLFALGTLVPPLGVPGSARRATGDDLGVLAAWRLAFAEEATHGWVDPRSPRETVARALRLGAAELLWEVDGAVVAQAATAPPVAGMSRIGPVYTPPEHRRRGYGGAVTAAATRWALDAGAHRVLLFTDLANPTTNAIYPRLGYRPVHDAVELTFAHG